MPRAPVQTVAALASLLVGACERRRRAPPPRDVEVTSVIVAADAAAPGCPARDLPRGGGTLHAGEVTRAERWRAADSPHLLPYGLVVRAGATLELEPCALLRVGPGRAVSVGPRGGLVARGEPLRPIVFERLGATPWVGLAVLEGAAGTTALAHVELVGAGGDAGEVIAASLQVAARGLVAQHVSVLGSAARGVWLRAGGSFAAGASVSVQRAAVGAAAVDDVNDVAALPLQPLRESETRDVLLTGGQATLRRDAVWGGRNARYAVRSGVRLRVEGSARPCLTIAPGTTLIFGEDSALEVGVDAPGALFAEGTRDEPMTLRGVDDRPASWLGVHLGAQIDLSRSAFRHLRVVSAGAPSGAAVGGCGCADDVRGDAAMLQVGRADIASIVENVLLHRGFARGVGVAWRCDAARPLEGLVTGGRVSVAPAAVACPELMPLGARPCAAQNP
jgi:hypothetical protein